jgi:hypothetical protein
MERPRIVGKTIADKEAHLASLRASIASFQKLAAEHGAAGNDAIAKKLLEVASASGLTWFRSKTSFAAPQSAHGPVGDCL